MTRSVEALRAALAPCLDTDQSGWLAEAEARVAAQPNDLLVVFPGVGRRVGRAPLDLADDPADVHAWTIDDAARVLLVLAAGPAVDLAELYRSGDPAERRGVLRSLDLLGEPAAGPWLVDDAIRTNEPRLIAAALGPYAARTLDDASYAQAVLKCVFVGIPLGPLAGLGERVTPELSRMLASYAHERIAAGRPITPDVWPPIARFPPANELAAIAAEREHPEAGRSAAARAAWADHLTSVQSPVTE